VNLVLGGKNKMKMKPEHIQKIKKKNKINIKKYRAKSKPFRIYPGYICLKCEKGTWNWHHSKLKIFNCDYCKYVPTTFDIQNALVNQADIKQMYEWYIEDKEEQNEELKKLTERMKRDYFNTPNTVDNWNCVVLTQLFDYIGRVFDREDYETIFGMLNRFIGPYNIQIDELKKMNKEMKNCQNCGFCKLIFRNLHACKCNTMKETYGQNKIEFCRANNLRYWKFKEKK
jgi:glutaredoxin